MNIALVLSGGGAKGSFQVGVERYLWQIQGYRWGVVAGVSVGALNAAMVAQRKQDDLKAIWEHLSNEDVYSGKLSLWTLLRIALGKDSIYSNKPLDALIRKHVDVDRIEIPCLIGTTNLTTGAYSSIKLHELTVPEAAWRCLLASTAIPVIWKPGLWCDEQWADGGVRNIAPIADVLHYNPDEIIIVNCSERGEMQRAQSLDNAVAIGLRALDIATDEIFQNDVDRFISINRLVQQAEKQGAVLHHSDRRPYRSVPYTIIEPAIDLGGTLDFTCKANRMRYEHGWRRAQALWEEKEAQ